MGRSWGANAGYSSELVSEVRAPAGRDGGDGGGGNEGSADTGKEPGSVKQPSALIRLLLTGKLPQSEEKSKFFFIFLEKVSLEIYVVF